MAKRSRTELKNIFSKGKIPDEKDFHDLIDSLVNLNDERLAGNPGGGLIIFEGHENTLLEFYQSPEAEGPDWYIRRENGTGELGLDIGESVLPENARQLKPKSRLFIEHGGGMGINNPRPLHTLDVSGAVAMENRVGTYTQGTVPADGQWRDILPPGKHAGPEGYFALEIMAHTVSNKESSLHAVSHAVCVGAYPRGTSGIMRLFGFNNRRGISATDYFYSKRGHRIQFRWDGTPVQPRVEIRSRRKLKEVQIEYRVTSLFPA
jgi:hypothetical protein